MEIIEIAGGGKKPVIIRLAEEEDFKILTKKQYSFAWNLARRSAIIYKLHIEGEKDILGVMALVDIPGDKRIEIKLLASSVENQGRNKTYDRIAGCLIAFACRLSVDKYNVDACVSMVPKTELRKHYMQKFHMLDGGWQLYLEADELYTIINEYLL
jgi:hypothetical protein